jgi:hypothetical protein
LAFQSVAEAVASVHALRWPAWLGAKKREQFVEAMDDDKVISSPGAGGIVALISIEQNGREASGAGALNVGL